MSTVDYDAELAALKAESESLDTELEDVRKAEEQREAVREVRARVREQKNELRDAPKIAALVEEHGEPGVSTYIVKSTMGSVVVKKPKRAAFNYWQERTAKKGVVTEEHNRQLVGPCLLYPDKPTFDQWVDELPFLLTRVADAVVFLAGTVKEDIGKK